MEQGRIVTLAQADRGAFFALAAEYLPDSDPQRMERFARAWPGAFLALVDGSDVLGVAFGWPRRVVDPADDAFQLSGIAVRWEHWRRGLGRRLLAAFEAAAAGYGAARVSVGSAGGFVEEFYLACGYAPRQYKVWMDGAPRVAATFADEAAYRAFRRPPGDGFVVMEKVLTGGCAHADQAGGV